MQSRRLIPWLLVAIPLVLLGCPHGLPLPAGSGPLKVDITIGRATDAPPAQPSTPGPAVTPAVATSTAPTSPLSTVAPSPSPSQSSTPAPTPAATALPSPSPTVGPAAVIESIAGDGTALATIMNDHSTVAKNAKVNQPRAIAADDAGNVYYVDSGQDSSGFSVYCLRRIDPSGHLVTLIPPGSDHSFDALAYANGYLYFVDTNAGNGNFYKVDGQDVENQGEVWRIKTDGSAASLVRLAGQGTSLDPHDGSPAAGATFLNLSSLAVTRDGSTVYFGDQWSHRVWMLTGPYLGSSLSNVSSKNLIWRYAGSSPASFSATVSTGGGFTMSPLNGGYLGDGGPANQALLNRPIGLAVDDSGNLYISDANNYCIRKVDKATGKISLLAGTPGRYSSGVPGDGLPVPYAKIRYPDGLAYDGAGLVFADDYANQVRRIAIPDADPMDWIISRIAGNPDGSAGVPQGGTAPRLAALTVGAYGFSLAADRQGHIYLADPTSHHIWRITEGYDPN